MITSTFAHPYGVQLFSLWLSFLPAVAMGGLMVAAALRGDRGRVRISRVRVPASEQ